ncbi:MAG: fused MFS/spermidine synthase [Vicinamibacterales bacterium]|nr:fused MFS/spermidine synthase [Vicinamibacterales bacterium]
MPPQIALIALLALFFFSGVAGLLYQVLWLRLLSLVFGVTVYAAATVLASFMSGLALGSWIAGRAGGRLGHPVRAFAVIEVLIGVSALATPFALDAATAIYLALHEAAPGSLPLLTVARFLCSFLVLLVPTMLMGATLPLLSASSLVRGSRFGTRVGLLYAVNTAGALTGAMLTGYVLIGAIGIQRTFLIGASLNVGVGLLAWVLARQPSSAADEAPAPAAPVPPVTAVGRDRRLLVLAVMGVSGFASLALEIVWFRVLVQFLPATSYAFTTMLATVLGGIALGSALAAPLLRRERAWPMWLAFVQIGTSVAALASLAALAWSYAAGWRTGGLTQASIVAILPAAIGMGLGFPIGLRAWTMARPGVDPGQAEVARRVSILYSVNVVGAIAGSIAGGFLLLPLLGSRVSLVVLAALYLVSGLVLVVAHTTRARAFVTVAAALAIFTVAATAVPDPFDAALRRRHGNTEQIIWRAEGLQTSVSVHRRPIHNRVLYLDGLHQANDTAEMVRLHRVIGLLPMALHPDPARALVIGLGGGATPGAVSQHAGTEVDVVELSSTVVEGARYFGHVNYEVLDRPNVRLHVDDGRNFLLLTRRRFDVITADIIQPMHAGAGNLYSREYFTLVREALADGGLVLQWIGHRPETQYKLIMRTFLEVFPDATLWVDGNLMVGATRPLTVASGLIERKREAASTRAAFDDVGLDSTATLLSWYTAGPDEMRRFVGDGVVLSDDRPLVEYHRSLPADDPPVDVSGLRGDVQRIRGERQ